MAYIKDCFYRHHKLGPCKFVSEEGGKIIVEFFYSALRRKKVEVKKNEIERLILLEHTRVFVESNDLWKTGNIIMDHKDDGTITYDVQFPHQQYDNFPEQEIYTRCWEEHDDPTASLANGCIYTQFWHDRRQNFAETVVNQISACRGLTSLLSSNIEILPHQVEVARRVLEDPLQRYLLADEVGMGKTIEAGLIISHFLLDNSSGNVLIIVPNSLLFQWKMELEQKFSIFSRYMDRIFVEPFEEINNLSSENAAE